MSSTQRLRVVQQHAPWRLVLLLGGALLLVVASAWLAFEFGRSRAGFDGSAARAQRAQLLEQIEALERDARPLRLKIAMYETERVGQTRERTELSRNIGELQAEVAKLESELLFYKGVVGDKTPGDVMKIQKFGVTQDAAAGVYKLRLVLDRPLGLQDQITGKLRITVEGTRAGADTSLDLATLLDPPEAELGFSYRLVQPIERRFRLPAGFVPARTTVELTPARKGVNPVRETFIWNVEN
jgi:hypothetical protein